MTSTAQRQKIWFKSGDAECAAWHYPAESGACVVMAGGFAVTKEPATDRFAQRFHDAGLSVLAFDYRRTGESGGQPRQVISIRDQLVDWDAALRHAGQLPEVDPQRLAAWSFSLGGGHVIRLAAGHQSLAAAIAQAPNADGLAAARNATAFQRPSALARLAGRGGKDAIGGLVGRAPLMVPLSGAPGSVAVVTTPDAQHGDRALNPDGRYPDWQQQVAARSVLPLASYRPGRFANRVRCPLLVVVCDDDQTALPSPGVRAAERASRGELVRLPGGHYAPFLGAHDQAVSAELAFLRRHLLNEKPSTSPSSLPSPQGAVPA